MTFITSILGFILKFLFSKSSEERLGQIEERYEHLETSVKVNEEIETANRISSREQVLNVLDKGKLSLLISLFLVSACSNASVISPRCPNVIEWTDAQQAQMAKDIAKLPNKSLVPLVFADYYNLRERARKCKKAVREYSNAW